MQDRTAYFLGSVAMLVGALVLGGVLHQALVASSIALASPQAILGLLGSLALVVVGWRLERRSDPSEFVGDPDPGDADGEEWEEADYVFSDEELEGRADRGSE